MPDADRKAALKLMVPKLKKGDWDAAVLVFLREIKRLLTKNLAAKTRGDAVQPEALDDSGRSALRNLTSPRGVLGDGFGRGGGGGGGGEDGGGGGGDGIGGMYTRFVDRPPDGLEGLLLIPLAWGLAAHITGARRAAVERRRFRAIENELQGIETQA